MRYLDLTLPTAQRNLACDEALLESCESGASGEILRFWEPREPFVVLGYANKFRAEARVASCKSNHIPILRRCSGGGTVLQGPGCLNYALILRIHDSAHFKTVTSTNRFIMQQHRDALAPLVTAPVEVQGHTDLTQGGLKFSGNSQRRGRRCLLFHGTFLLRFDIPLVEKYLAQPAKQPSYRQNRAHSDFLTNLNLSSAAIKSALRKTWDAAERLQRAPLDRIEALAAQKYSTDDWNLRL